MTHHMRSRFALALLAVSLATGAAAKSNMVVTVTSDLRKKGVSEECLAKVTVNDAARLNSIAHDPDMSSGSKNRISRDFVNKICDR